MVAFVSSAYKSLYSDATPNAGLAMFTVITVSVYSDQNDKQPRFVIIISLEELIM